jgi:hypothetical protein
MNLQLLSGNAVDIMTQTFDFYGVDCNFFKLGDHVFEAVENPEDGWRSCCDDIVEVDEEALCMQLRGHLFFRQPLDSVRVQMAPAGDFYGIQVVSIVDGHVWLEVGTSFSDEYYPGFVFYYSPRVGP